MHLNIFIYIFISFLWICFLFLEARITTARGERRIKGNIIIPETTIQSLPAISFLKCAFVWVWICICKLYFRFHFPGWYFVYYWLTNWLTCLYAWTWSLFASIYSHRCRYECQDLMCVSLLSLSCVWMYAYDCILLYGYML